MIDILYSEMELLLRFDFSKDFVKDSDASKYMILQNFLNNAKRIYMWCKRIGKYKIESYNNFCLIEKNLLKLLINKINYFLLTNFITFCSVLT